MPLYLDIHARCYCDGGARAHMTDLQAQGKHEAQALADEQRGKAFCPVEAASVTSRLGT
jgi:hypothetical protein